ncbi:MAG: hypothetical protein ABI867_45305 [Kofleriaceae bacterium]
MRPVNAYQCKGVVAEAIGLFDHQCAENFFAARISGLGLLVAAFARVAQRIGGRLEGDWVAK